jgi:hypothetical protein
VTGELPLIPLEHRDNIRAFRIALYPTSTSNTLLVTNPLGQHNSLSGGNPTCTTQLVASHPSSQEEDCSNNGYTGSLPEEESDLSVRNGILLYKQLIHHMMDYACPAWRSAARTYVRRLEVLQSKCLLLATGAP